MNRTLHFTGNYSARLSRVFLLKQPLFNKHECSSVNPKKVYMCGGVCKKHRDDLSVDICSLGVHFPRHLRAKHISGGLIEKQGNTELSANREAGQNANRRHSARILLPLQKRHPGTHSELLRKHTSPRSSQGVDFILFSNKATSLPESLTVEIYTFVLVVACAAEEKSQRCTHLGRSADMWIFPAKKRELLNSRRLYM